MISPQEDARFRGITDAELEAELEVRRRIRELAEIQSKTLQAWSSEGNERSGVIKVIREIADEISLDIIAADSLATGRGGSAIDVIIERGTYRIPFNRECEVVQGSIIKVK